MIRFTTYAEKCKNLVLIFFYHEQITLDSYLNDVISKEEEQFSVIDINDDDNNDDISIVVANSDKDDVIIGTNDEVDDDIFSLISGKNEAKRGGIGLPATKKNVNYRRIRQELVIGQQF